MTLPVSVVITCKNERLNIRECVAAARLVADEIVVADSGSTDGTLDLIRAERDVRLIERVFVSYANFKNWAIPQCRNEWVLIVDADERITPELAAEIKATLAANPVDDAYWIPRQSYFLGHHIRFAWPADRVVRLVRRDACRYEERPVHEKMLVPSGRVGRLRSMLLHYTAWDVEGFVAKQNRYSTLMAVDRHRDGRKVSLLWTLIHAPLRFAQVYFLRGGFRDGFPGLAVCGITAAYTFLKDVKLWSLTNLKNPPAGLKTALDEVPPRPSESTPAKRPHLSTAKAA